MKFIEEDEFDPEADVPRVREILGFTVEQRDPYGFLYLVKKGKKAIPDELSGAYTTPTKVQDAITHYLSKSKDQTVNAS